MRIGTDAAGRSSSVVMCVCVCVCWCADGAREAEEGVAGERGRDRAPAPPQQGSHRSYQGYALRQ